MPRFYLKAQESFYTRKELNSHRIGLGHQHGRCFIVLQHQYGCRDVTCIDMYVQKHNNMIPP